MIREEHGPWTSRPVVASPDEFGRAGSCASAQTRSARWPAAHYHWFMGTGLVHGVRLRGGRAEWLSQPLHTERGTRPPPWANLRFQAPGEDQRAVNTNVEVIGGRVHAIVEGGPLPIELDYDLESVARFELRRHA